MRNEKETVHTTYPQCAGAVGALSKGIAPLGGLQMERGWCPWYGDVLITRGGEERAVLAWVDRVILKKKIIFFNDCSG